MRRLGLALLLAACGSSAIDPADAGTAAGDAADAGSGSQAPPSGPLGAGPWGDGNRSYGAADGILEQPVVGASTDEGQNLWVATHDALYLLKPGEKTFRRFDARDGLHLPGNPVLYCDRDFGDHACPLSGAAAAPGISEIEGGRDGEVFVGYFGIDDGPADWTDPNRHSGKLDRVRLSSNGLAVDRMDLVSSNTAQFWHNRTVQRLLYDHVQHPHELYVGTNHGVDRLWPDKYRAPAKGEWFLQAANEWMSDHLHPQVCFHQACDATESNLRLGDWKGLALSKDGNLWVAGRWTAGQIRWTPDLTSWWNRGGHDIFSVAFGDPYRGPCSGFCNQPVFMVPQEGEVVSLQATAVGADGRVWFASGRTTSYDQPRGLAAWDGHGFAYFDPVRDAGLGDADVRDLAALPDGRLAVASAAHGLVLWNPQTGKSTAVDLPDPHVFRLELDQMVTPPTLYVSTYGGVAALRKLP